MRTNVFKTKDMGIQIGKPSAVLTDLEIRKLEKLKEQVFADIISRPKGTIKVEKDWLIDDSELNNIQKIDDSDIIKAFSFSNKITLGRVKVHKQKVHKQIVANEFSVQLPLKSKMA